MGKRRLRAYTRVMAEKTGTKERLVVLALNVAEIICRAAVLFLIMAVHYALDFMFQMMFAEWTLCLLVTKACVFAGFAVVYVALVYEIVAVFVPSLKMFFVAKEIEETEEG